MAHAGRKPAELVKECGCSTQSIATFVARAAAERGKPMRGRDVLTSAERDEELARLRRANRQLRQERDILAKVPPWIAGKGNNTFNWSTNS